MVDLRLDGWENRKLNTERYFNSGVMLFNFKKFREDGMPEKIAEFIKQHPKTNYADQTAMNVMFNGKGIKLIPEKFDWLQLYLDDAAALAKRPFIHYVSGIPWLPKIAVVANGRFKLWHAFADKYVWQKKGESLRRLMPWNALFIKRLEHALLVTPVLCQLFFIALKVIGKGQYLMRWKKVMTEYDVSLKVVENILT